MMIEPEIYFSLKNLSAKYFNKNKQLCDITLKIAFLFLFLDP